MLKPNKELFLSKTSSLKKHQNMPTSKEFLAYSYFYHLSRKGKLRRREKTKLHYCSSEDVLAGEIPFKEKFNNFLPEYSPLLKQL